MLAPDFFLGLNEFWGGKKFGSKKCLGPYFFLGKHHLCVRNIFLLGSVIVDLGLVLVVFLVLLVT